MEVIDKNRTFPGGYQLAVKSSLANVKFLSQKGFEKNVCWAKEVLQKFATVDHATRMTTVCNLRNYLLLLFFIADSAFMIISSISLR